MIGSLIAGHIRIQAALGQGGMGEIYAGVDERLGRRVAVKTIRSDRSDAARQRFLREARALSALDHPGICRLLEYISTPEEDYLVLELIDGVTLGRAVERGMSRAAKLRVASDILRALLAAHRKGIVHQDLKPDNIMITADGGVKILDFGLARLEAMDERILATGAAGDGGDENTLIFPLTRTVATPRPVPVIAGTPLYMSPEQATGGEITPASDMYSFGLLLQSLLTEQPPQEASLGRDVLLRRAARAESRAITGQSRELTALVNALKQHAPAERPSAAEALAQLQRIVDAPKRRLRLAAAIIAITLVVAGAAKYAFDVTKARNEAQQRRRQAEELVSFMVGDLRKKLEPVGRLDVLDAAASHALAYFASLHPDELTGDDLDHNARALAQLGQVRVDAGKLTQAVQLFRQSLRFASAAVQRDPAREEWQLTLSNAHFWLGDALRRQGNIAQTLPHFQEYFAISQRLAQRHPDNAGYQAEVSYSHGNLGAAYEAAGDLPRALVEYRTACELDRQRLRRAPKNEQWQSDLANSANRLGVVLKGIGDFPNARRAFDEDLQLRRRLAQAAPDDARRQKRLETSLAFAGTLQQATGDTEQALASYREEAALAAKLAAADPANADARRNRDVAQMRVATMVEPSAGLPVAEAATRDLRALVRADARAVWRRDLASALVKLAIIESRLHRTGARATADEAMTLSELLHAERPQDAACNRFLAEALLTAADLDEREHHSSLASSRRNRAAAIAGSSDHDPTVAALHVRALLALGRRDEARSITAKVLAGGYREAEFVALTADAHSPP
jgi:serine/threonine-protein kinase